MTIESGGKTEEGRMEGGTAGRGGREGDSGGRRVVDGRVGQADDAND